MKIFREVIFIVRFLGALIKYFIYLCILLIAAGAALFWMDTGSWLVLPLAQRAGNFFLDPLKLDINNINGSLHNGYSVEGIKLISGDEDLFTLDYASVSPDWDSVLQGMDGLPFIKSLNVSGISSDMEKVNALVKHFASSKDKGSEESIEPFNLKLKPFNAAITNVNFSTPFANLSLDKITLNEDGIFNLNTKIISNENILPLGTTAKINLDPIEIISSDLFIGKKSTGAFSGTLEPLKARLDLTALSLDELLKFAPPLGIKATGRVDGRIFVNTDEEKNITASGVVSMPRANIMDIPLSFRLPFRWNGINFIALDNAELKTKAANFRLNASADIDELKVKAAGSAQNISLNEIGSMFAPDAKLQGENGYIYFDVDTVLSGDIMKQTKAELNIDMPLVAAQGIRMVKDLKARAKIIAGEAPDISMSGEVFGGKLFARGEALQDKKGNFKPQAVFSVVNLDLKTLANAFPEIAKSINKPSGKITASAAITEDLNVNAKITSERISANGFTVTKLFTLLNYDNQKKTADLEELSVNLGRGVIKASGNVNLNDETFGVIANADRLDPRIIPELKDLSGLFMLNASASGKYSDMNSIRANANLEARNVGYSDMKIGNISVPVNYSANKIEIPRAVAVLPGGRINFAGNVNLANTSNPEFYVNSATDRIDIARVLKDLNLGSESMPVSGIVRGNVNIRGNLKDMVSSANLYADNVKVGEIVNMPNAAIELEGNAKRINVKTLQAKINDAIVRGRGGININQKNFAASAVNIDASVKQLALKPFLTLAMGSAPVTGMIDSRIKLDGTISQPSLNLNIDSPIYYDKYMVEDIALKLRSPEANHYVANASARVEDFRAEADVDLKKNGDVWAYKVETKPIDIDTAITMQNPDMSGLAKGFVIVNVEGDTKPDSSIKLRASANEIKLIDKISIKQISLPVVYKLAEKNISMQKGRAVINNGIINTAMNVDLNKSTWNGKVNVSHLNFGQLVQPFMPEGELVGSVDVSVNMKGGFALMPLSFANGKFETTPGYLHKIGIIDTVTPTKKISFEKISGTFFWDGTDLFLNPGTEARAGADEPLYRYFTINGSAGIPGKGLRLVCDGRFDLKLLDRLLGAMKGIFQYMTGTFAQNALKESAGRILGVKSKDFQTVSFTLANSWNELRLLNMKITKPIEDFLPINVLNKDEEEQKSETQFKMRLRIPTGPGDTSVEEESTEDQFKQQLIDNLFNIGL